MRRWCRTAVSLILVTVLTLVLAACGSSEQESPTCYSANQMLTEDSYEEAREAYNAIIARSAETQEKTTTDERTVGRGQTTGNGITTGGSGDSEECAQTGLKLVSIFTLADLGLYEEAREQLVTFIEEHPETEVPEDLMYLFGGQLEGWDRIKRQAGPELLSVVEILATIAIALLAVVALRRRVWPWIQSFLQPLPFLDIQDFVSETDNLKGGKGFAMMVEDKIGEISSPDSSLTPGIVNASTDPIAVPESLVPTPYLKVLSQLIGWVVPRRIITLSGCLLAPGDEGAGLTLLLTESWTGDVIGSQTIWEADYGFRATGSGSPDSGSYYDLAEWAAVWTWYEVIDRYS